MSDTNRLKRKATNVYTLRMNDDVVFTVTREVVVQSVVLNEMFLDNLTGSNETVIPNIDGAMFSIILEFCNLHVHDPLYVVSESGPIPLVYKDYLFLKNYEAQFFDILKAADFLDIPRLMDAILAYIREYYITGHTTKSICTSLGLDRKSNETTTAAEEKNDGPGKKNNGTEVVKSDVEMEGDVPGPVKNVANSLANATERLAL